MPKVNCLETFTAHYIAAGGPSEQKITEVSMRTLLLKIGSIAAVAAILVLAAGAATQGSKLGKTRNERDLKRRDRVPVSNIEQLYAAVNDPHNAGREIAAAPGVYMLSTTDSSGVPRPNGGRLEFQEDMSLVGVEGDRSAVVISGINLPASVLPNAPIPFGAIRLGRGRNAVEWLTVRDTRGGQGNIVTGLAWPGTQYVRVAHVASTGATNYNLSLFNFGTAPVLEADIVDNDLFDAFGGMRGGFRIRNSSSGVINLRLVGNRVWGNQLNFIINTAATGATTNVVSIGNNYFDNGNGLTVVGGFNASGNTINFHGYGDSYTNNNAGSTLERGGLVIVAGDKGAPVPGTTPIPANDNTVNVSLHGCRFSGNERWDLAAIGARSFAGAVGSPGDNNHVTLNMTGIPRRPPFVEFFAGSIPAEFSATNSVTVIR